MIGFYNYTVILTYLSLISGAVGIYFSLTESPVAALFCLLFSGFADMFDGKIARTRHKSTSKEKKFGIQIDSLTDIVCFCVLPAVMGMYFADRYGNLWLLPICVALILCGLIRLAYFNVMEEERQSKEKTNRKYYNGLPVTTSAIIIPFIFCFEPLFRPELSVHEQFPGWSTTGFAILFAVFTGLTALFYILPIKVRKPHKAGVAVMGVIGVAELAVIVCNYCLKLF